MIVLYIIICIFAAIVFFKAGLRLAVKRQTAKRNKIAAAAPAPPLYDQEQHLDKIDPLL